MAIHRNVEYSGFESPRRTMPYFEKATPNRRRTIPKVMTRTRAPNQSVKAVKSQLAAASDWVGMA